MFSSVKFDATQILLILDFSEKRYYYAIIDSNEESICQLQEELKNYPSYSCVGVAKNSDEAVNLIIDKTPNLVFFDPIMAVNGVIESTFSIISETYHLIQMLPHFIAMNESNEYAFKALNNGVFGYVLKPFRRIELKKTLIRFENTQSKSGTICLKSFSEFRFLLIADIIYLKADNNTTDFYLKDGTIVTSFKTLKTFENELPNIFTRIHKSYMINVKYINKIHFNKFQCSMKHTSAIIPFSKTLKTRMLEIKNFWLKGSYSCNQLHINVT